MHEGNLYIRESYNCPCFQIRNQLCRWGIVVFENKWGNKLAEFIEQIGRIGCFGFMIINIPGTWLGWLSDDAFAIYLVIDTLLAALYCAIWGVCWRKNNIFRALALSIIPSVLFLFSGIMSRSFLLIVASIIFAPSHILISYQNAK